MTSKGVTDKRLSAAPAGPDTYRLKDGVAGIKSEMTHSQMIAKVATDAYLSATTLKAFAGGGDRLEITDLIGEMRTVSKEVNGSNLTRIEDMLVHQALALDAMFNNMAQASVRVESLKGMETYMRLALKAQAQARATAEALAMLKNPMPYIKQANISSGPQMVNNGQPSGAGKSQSAQNELLEHQHGNYLDTGTQGTASSTDTHLEAVGAVNRAKHA